MDVKIESLRRRIEYLRELLYIMISNKELTDESVVNCSQLLDNLLWEYEECTQYIRMKQTA